MRLPPLFEIAGKFDAFLKYGMLLLWGHGIRALVTVAMETELGAARDNGSGFRWKGFHTVARDEPGDGAGDVVFGEE